MIAHIFLILSSIISTSYQYVISPVFLNDNLTLPCGSDTNSTAELLMWITPKREKIYPSSMHQSDRMTIELVSKKLIITGVNNWDVGTFTCVLWYKGTSEQQPTIETYDIAIPYVITTENPLSRVILAVCISTGIAVIIVALCLVHEMLIRKSKRSRATITGERQSTIETSTSPSSTSRAPGPTATSSATIERLTYTTFEQSSIDKHQRSGGYVNFALDRDTYVPQSPYDTLC